MISRATEIRGADSPVSDRGVFCILASVVLPFYPNIHSTCGSMLLLSPWRWLDDESGGAWGPPPRCRGSIDLTSLTRIAEASPGQARGWGIFLCDEIPVGLTDDGGVILASDDLRDARPDGKLLDAWESNLGWRPQGETLADLLWDQLTNGSDPTGIDRNGILVPRVDGRLQLWLGSLVREERFVFGEHPHTAKLKELLQRQLGQARDLALSGDLIDPLTDEPDVRYHLRLADAMAEKYAGRNPAAKADFFALLKPSTWDRADELQPHATTITDDFNTADSDTFGHNLSWTELSGDWDIVSNQAQMVTNFGSVRFARADSDLSSADHYAQVAVISRANPGFLGPICRKDSTSTITCYAGGWPNQNTNPFRIRSYVNGTATDLGSGGTAAFSSGDVNKLSCNGSTITLYKNGVSLESVTDTSIASGLRCGLCALDNAGTAGVPALDNFEAGDLAAPGVVYPQLERGIRGLNRGLCLGMR